MPLYVIRPPDPPAGQDWQASVPGQYVYDVTGVYATLTTFALPATTIPDASGNGNDGHYFQYAPPGGPDFTAGLVVGNDAVLAAGTIPSHEVQVQGPAAVIDWTTSWCITWWEQLAVNSGTAFKYVADWNSGTEEIVLFATYGAGANFLVIQGGATDWTTVTDAIPNDGLPHFFGVQFDHNTGLAECYVDGALVAWATTGTPPATATASSGTFELGNGALIAADITDELAIFRNAFLAVFFSNLFAHQGDFTAYAAAVASGTPELYYHLAPNAPSTGRQVVLNITDGTNDVELLCSGFDPLATPGPYAWSWLPKLNSAAESPDSATVTVPLPKEVLPAGYTIGTVTLDIEPTDQWSDIAIWWNSDIMDSTVSVEPYAFPPGALLVYQQIQGAS